MAIIYSNRNDNASTHATANALATSTWAGGVVPNAADQVYVVGRRTTINQTAFAKWVGTITITVASTANFASSGFFYTHTNGGEVVKVNYTGTTATTFTGCSIDETDPFYRWTSGQTIANGSYVHNPAYIIEINNGQTFECAELIIQEGGWLKINAGGTLLIRQGILMRDGRLIGRDTGTITISRPAGTAASSTVGYFTLENNALSIVDIDGGEVRAYSTLAANANINDVSISINSANNGSFAVGDEIAIYEEGENGYRRRNFGYTGYRDATANFKDMDEGLDVVGVSGNTVYVGMRNGARGTVKASTTVGSQKAIDVQPDSVYFNVGDKILINNVGYTIDAIEDSEYTLYDYDFTNPATSLSDFWVNDDSIPYSSGWEIVSGVGLRNTSAAYREFIHKYLWTREVIVEAEMSPLSNYTSGTRGTGAFGIATAYDPSFRIGHRAFDSFKSDYFVVDEGNLDVVFYIRSMSAYNNNRQDRDSTLLNITRNPALYRVDTRKMRTTVSIAGQEFTTEYRRDGSFKGLVGLISANNNFRCRRLTIKVPTQKIYITTNNTISNGSIVYRSGIDHQHPAGSKVVKISSINTGNGSHKDLAFCYRGQNGSGIFPIVRQVNGANTTNVNLPYIHNHDMNADYYHNLGETTSEVSVTIDLMQQSQFTHVSFNPRTVDTGGFYGYNGVTIYGSNDMTNWTTLYGPTNDTKKWYGGGGSYNRLAYYPTGTVSYRYVKFATKGDQGGANRNRYINIGVHDFSEGYTIDLNNASDFAIGDQVTVLSDSGYYWASREIEAYQARITANVAPEDYFHGGWEMICTITNKVGNKIYLDKPVFWGYVEDADSVTVVKVNRNFKIQGFIGTNNVFSDSWRWPNIISNAGANTCRKYFFKNIRMNYIGSARNSGSGSWNRGVVNNTYDYWNAAVFDGVVHNMGPDNTTYAGVGNNQGHVIYRNSVVLGMYSGYHNYNAASYSGAAFFNNKIMGCLNGYYSELLKVFAFNYNEITTFDVGFSCYTTRLDRNIIPHFNEVKFNTLKGNSTYGFRLNNESFGPVRSPRIQIESNKLRAMDDGTFYPSGVSDGWPHVNANYMSEHTGSRMSRYRNEGPVIQTDTSSDLVNVGRMENFGRFGYDLTHGAYYTYELDYSRPEITRVYPCTGDSLLTMFGIEIEVLDNIPFQIYVKFDYLIPWIAKIQDDGTDDGRLRVYAVQNGSQSGALQYGLVPSTITPYTWNTFEYTFNSFTSTIGKAAVYLNRVAQNGYTDFKNSTCVVRTDYPDKIRVLGNNFIMKNVWDQYNGVRNIVPLTSTNARTINITRLKF